MPIPSIDIARDAYVMKIDQLNMLDLKNLLSHTCAHGANL